MHGPIAGFKLSMSKLHFNTSERLAQFKDVDVVVAKEWLKEIRLGDIPRDRFKITYSRAGGPGGQHVNKVNTKATISCDLNDLNWLPTVIYSLLKESDFKYLTPSKRIVVQSDTNRHQQDNVEECFVKFLDGLKKSIYIPSPESPEKIKKWDEIRAKANETRLKYKKIQAEKRQRRKSFD
ncbi:hypothetical protein V1514DRAFT_365967 [Lipomyces japonicus]|uniref:uncharacterized protein n=1 Tax=Lipomyces japonicus TaxID=56871 RepID=UPI0034CFDF95